MNASLLDQANTSNEAIAQDRIISQANRATRNMPLGEDAGVSNTARLKTGLSRI
jgi:hypothetical protein